MPEASTAPIRSSDLASVVGVFDQRGVLRAQWRAYDVKVDQGVQELAAKMGYEPNAAARSLRKSGSPEQSTTFRGTLGYRISTHADAQMRRKEGRESFPWNFEVIHRARRLGYSLDIFVANVGGKSCRLNRVLRARGVRGVIISASHHDPRDYEIDSKFFPAVGLHAHSSAHSLHNLSVPYFQDTYDAARHLLARGYQRIGFLMVGNVLDSFLGESLAAVRWIPCIQCLPTMKSARPPIRSTSVFVPTGLTAKPLDAQNNNLLDNAFGQIGRVRRRKASYGGKFRKVRSDLKNIRFTV